MTPLETLARYRTISARESANVVRLGEQLLAQATKLGTEEWAVREQITIAALDIGNIPLAETQISLLSARFPSSPRLLVLQALHLESRGKYASAKVVYHALLGKREGVEVASDSEGGDDGGEGRQVIRLWKGEGDECFVTAHQRLITLSLYPPPPPPPSTTTPTAQPTPSEAAVAATVPLLTTYLATFHQDTDAWALLADLYLLSSPGMRSLHGWGSDAAFHQGTTALSALRGGRKTDGGYLEQAMACLAQWVLLEPWEWKALVRFAEIGLLSGDVTFAYKTLLRAVEISSQPYPGSNDPAAPDDAVMRVEGGEWREVMAAGGWKTRVWWDLAICTTVLASASPPLNESLSPDPPAQVSAVRKLVVTRLEALLGKGVVDTWEQGVLGELKQ